MNHSRLQALPAFFSVCFLFERCRPISLHLGDKSHLQGSNILTLSGYFTIVTNLLISMLCGNKVVKADVDLKPIQYPKKKDQLTLS